MCRIALNLHAPAPAIALLAPPKFAVDKRLLHLHSGGQAGQEGDQRFAMRFSRCKVAQHKLLIVPDATGLAARPGSSNFTHLAEKA
jgi:hypothetical protein